MVAAARGETFGFNQGGMKERRRLMSAGPDGSSAPVKSSNATEPQLRRHKDQLAPESKLPYGR